MSIRWIALGDRTASDRACFEENLIDVVGHGRHRNTQVRQKETNWLEGRSNQEW